MQLVGGDRLFQPLAPDGCEDWAREEGGVSVLGASSPGRRILRGWDAETVPLQEALGAASHGACGDWEEDTFESFVLQGSLLSWPHSTPCQGLLCGVARAVPLRGDRTGNHTKSGPAWVTSDPALSPETLCHVQACGGPTWWLVVDSG